MGGGGYDAYVAIALAVGLVEPADGDQTGKFTLGSGIGLERDFGKAGNFRQPPVKVVDDCLVTGPVFTG